MDYTHRYVSPLGSITLASDGEALTGLWFDGQKRFAEGRVRIENKKLIVGGKVLDSAFDLSAEVDRSLGE